MDKKSGYEYARENGYINESRGDFYKLFKTIVKLRDISSTEKLVLTIVMSYTDIGQEFYMSNNTLAIEAGMDYSSVIRTISSLRDKGYVKTYKVINTSKNLIIGRTVVPQKQFVAEQIIKTWNNFEYIEYGGDSEEE